jgi:hypothetical protein
LSFIQIDTMFVDDGAGVRLLPSLASRNKIRILRSWHSHLQLVQGTRCVNWLDTGTVNEDTWEDYRVGVYIPAEAPTVPTQRATVTNSCVSRPVLVQSPAPMFVVPASDATCHPKNVIEEMFACLTEVGVVIDGRAENGELHLDDEGALEFENDDVYLGSKGVDLVVYDAIGTSSKTSTGNYDPNKVPGCDGCCRLLVDCCHNEYCCADKFLYAVAGGNHLVLGDIGNDDMEEGDFGVCFSTGVASTCERGSVTKMVFDPGGRFPWCF